jgi:hypothetical protein
MEKEEYKEENENKKEINVELSVKKFNSIKSYKTSTDSTPTKKYLFDHN